jgi:hypothetical protein
MPEDPIVTAFAQLRCALTPRTTRDPGACAAFTHLTLMRLLTLSAATLTHVSTCHRCRIILRASTLLPDRIALGCCTLLLHLKRRRTD